jgi:hypothetical protein
MLLKRWTGWIALTLVLAGCAGVPTDAKEANKASAPPAAAIDSSIRLEDYPTVLDKRIVGPFWLYIREPAKSETDGGLVPLWDVLEIRRGEGPNGTLVYLNSETRPSFGSDFLQIPDWKGAPLVGVRTNSGGNHCCTGIVLLHLSDPVKVVAEIEFKDLDDSPFYVQQRGEDLAVTLPVTSEMIVCPANGDHPLLEYHISYCASLIIGPDGYRLDTAGLQKHHEDLEVEAKSLRETWESNAENQDETDCESPVPPAELWQTLSRLVYTGAGDDCRPLIERVWPKHYPGKNAYWEGFMQELKTSPYWEDIRKLNEWK